MRDGGAQRAAALAVAASLLLLPGCAGKSKQPQSAGVQDSTGTTIAVRGGALPPPTGAALDRLVDGMLRAQGWRLDRATLLRDNTPDATVVLSIYAKPLSGLSDDDYAKTLAPLTAAMLPTLMDRYPGVGAIDLCQLPIDTPKDVTEPPPTTRVLIRRPDMHVVDWSDFSLTKLLVAAGTKVDRYRGAVDLFALPRVRKTPTWQAAEAAA